MPLPLVQPDAPTSPLAFDQPPEYQAQSTCLSDRRSPIVGVVSAGSRTVEVENGCWNGWIVFTAKSPQAIPGGVGAGLDAGLHEAVSCVSLGGVAVPVSGLT